MENCGLEQVIDLIGDRWSLLLVGVLLSGPRRTTELAAVLAPISTRTLAERLKRLEAAGLLTRRAYAEAPPRVVYELTASGHAARPVIASLRGLADSWDRECERVACRVCDAHRDELAPVELVADEAPVADAPPLARRAAAVDVTLL